MKTKQTETIDRVFLELSQFTTVATAREIALQDHVRFLRQEIVAFLESDSDVEDYERLQTAVTVSKAWGDK